MRKIFFALLCFLFVNLYSHSQTQYETYSHSITTVDSNSFFKNLSLDIGYMNAFNTIKQNDENNPLNSIQEKGVYIGGQYNLNKYDRPFIDCGLYGTLGKRMFNLNRTPKSYELETNPVFAELKVPVNANYIAYFDSSQQFGITFSIGCSPLLNLCVNQFIYDFPLNCGAGLYINGLVIYMKYNWGVITQTLNYEANFEGVYGKEQTFNYSHKRTFLEAGVKIVTF
ncbi:MAG: hypothetical protein J6T94_00510 [Bacteroidaceae bacterium]|nr:hypothetical protein [Bacteroidaceae bacterium]